MIKAIDTMDFLGKAEGFHHVEIRLSGTERKILEKAQVILEDAHNAYVALREKLEPDWEDDGDEQDWGWAEIYIRNCLEDSKV
jgi:hypothetical protein